MAKVEIRMTATEFPEDLYENDDEISDIPEKPDIETTLRLLVASVDGSFDAVVFYGLSALTESEINRVQAVWDSLPDDYRIKLLQRLVDTSETNFDLDYRGLAFYALSDDHPEVRTAAIELLWEDETLELMQHLIEMAQWDESISVRSAAASALGRFILLGELGDLPEVETMRAQDAVVELLTNQDEDVEVRRRSLEAIANCSHEIVDEAIEEAYHSLDSRMRASALFAMGKTCDAQWSEIVLRELDSDDPEFRFEAARASGELELEEAIPSLTRLAQSGDREIKEAAIWALGEIGGGQVIKILTVIADSIAETGDDDLLEAVEEAISIASLPGKDFDFDFDD